MLRKMETKGVVAHRTEGRQFVYTPTVTESEVRRSMVAELTDHLFQGDAVALVSHLVDEGEIDGKELERLRALIRTRPHARHAHERENGRDARMMGQVEELTRSVDELRNEVRELRGVIFEMHGQLETLLDRKP